MKTETDRRAGIQTTDFCRRGGSVAQRVRSTRRSIVVLKENEIAQITRTAVYVAIYRRQGRLMEATSRSEVLRLDESNRSRNQNFRSRRNLLNKNRRQLRGP